MNPITQALVDLVARIPTSREPVSEDDPTARARAIGRAAAMRAAGISGTLALPPGPLGLATVLPDLVAIWRLQQTMVADIAAVFDRSALLQKEAMVYCLFKHGSAAVLRDLVVRTGERYLIRGTATRVLHGVLEKVGARVSRQFLEKSLARWLPVIGAVGVGAYAYYDTAKVASTAIDLFSRDVALDDPTAPAKAECDAAAR